MRNSIHEKSEVNDIFHSWRNDGHLPSSVYLPNPNGEYSIHPPPPLLPQSGVSFDQVQHLSTPSSSSSSTPSSAPSSFSSSSQYPKNKEINKRKRRKVK
jgi:hypothetical protein